MAYSPVPRRIFALLIVGFGSVLCSSHSADITSDFVVLENFANNTSKQYDIYKGIVLPKAYETIADSIENFQVRDDDVWICTFQRSGTTWTQEMIWLIANDLDYDGARVPLTRRWPFLEISAMVVSEGMSTADALKSVENIARLASPRFIKTHLPFHLLPRQLREREKKAKIVHVSRNPKDLSISQYHHYRWVWEYSGTLEDLSQAFMEGRVIGTPYWNHVNGYLERRGDENMLLLKFEDMKSDLQSQIKKTAKFLGKTLSDQQTKVLEDHLTFKNMQKNPAVNQENMNALRCKGNPCEETFIRNGEVGQWKTVMSKELIEQFDDWIKTNSGE